MQPPVFWFTPPEKPSIWARLLTPLGAIYAQATAWRIAHKGYEASVPVISVGNLNLGGTGKTPTVIALVEAMSRRKVHVVSRGYGGRETGPHRVDERRDTASDVGDEPLLLSSFAPVWVARDRAAGVRAAETAGPEVVVLDDAHQNGAVQKSLSIVTVDATVGFGNGRVCPAGPLREPVEIGLARADIVILIGRERERNVFLDRWRGALAIPVVEAELEPLATGMDWHNLRVLAFAGIGRPGKFFETLDGVGADIARKVPLDDHQTLNATLLSRLESEAEGLGAQLVTTEKDAVRLPDAFRAKVLTLPVRLRLVDDGPLRALLETILG